jgi:hypothetical protein
MDRGVPIVGCVVGADHDEVLEILAKTTRYGQRQQSKNAKTLEILGKSLRDRTRGRGVKPTPNNSPDGNACCESRQNAGRERNRV